MVTVYRRKRRSILHITTFLRIPSNARESSRQMTNIPEQQEGAWNLVGAE